MYVTKLKIQRFEGLEEVSIEPSPGMTLITGPNGAGKTSVLDAIRAALTNRGTRSELVRQGTDSGLILFELSDGTQGQREVTPGRTAGSIVLADRNGEPQKATSFLKSLGIGFGFNPLKFLELRADQQTKQLLELTQFNITIPELIALGGERLDSVQYTNHPLIVLEQIGTALEEKRRDTGRSARDTEGMADDLRGRIPTDFDIGEARKFDLGDAAKQMGKIDSLAKRNATISGQMLRIETQIESLRTQLLALENEYKTNHMSLRGLPPMQELQDKLTYYETSQGYLHDIDMAFEQDAKAVTLREQYALLNDMIADVRKKPGELLLQSPPPYTRHGYQGRSDYY